MKNLRIIILILCIFSKKLTICMEQFESQLSKNIELVKAVKDNKVSNVISLIEDGADVNYKINTYNNTSILLLSINLNHIKIAKTLIKAGADINAKTNNGYTPLIWLICKNSDTKLINFLIKYGADVNARNNQNYTPLICAARNGNKEIVKLLINSGADINCKTCDILKSTALSNSYQNNHTKIIRLLKKTVKKWKEELYKAINEKDYENFIKYLKKVGTVCLLDKNNNNLLHYSMISGNIEATKLIYYLKPDLIAQANTEGETPLSFVGANIEFLFLFQSLLPKEDIE